MSHISIEYFPKCANILSVKAPRFINSTNTIKKKV